VAEPLYDPLNAGDDGGSLEARGWDHEPEDAAEDRVEE
jgi:hypothetical protein